VRPELQDRAHGPHAEARQNFLIGKEHCWERGGVENEMLEARCINAPTRARPLHPRRAATMRRVSHIKALKPTGHLLLAGGGRLSPRFGRRGRRRGKGSSAPEQKLPQGSWKPKGQSPRYFRVFKAIP
jgi:hypothetical protein